MHRASPLSEALSEHGRSSKFPAATSSLVERSIFAPADARSNRSNSRRVGFAGTHRAVWRLRRRWSDLFGIARRNAARLWRQTRTFFAFANGRRLRVEPGKRRTLPRTASPTIVDRHRLRDRFSG